MGERAPFPHPPSVSLLSGEMEAWTPAAFLEPKQGWLVKYPVSGGHGWGQCGFEIYLKKLPALALGGVTVRVEDGLKTGSFPCRLSAATREL